MADNSIFRSRTGYIEHSPESIFNFITDLRNFTRFIPEGRATINDLQRDACSFNVSMLGTVNISVAEKHEYNKVLYTGNILQLNNFTLTLEIERREDRRAEVNLSLVAEMNPVMKMVANEPVRQLLETLVKEMEAFDDWENTI